MRVFFCLPVDQNLRQALAKLSCRLKRTLSVRATWVRPDNFHVTVRFLGEIDPMLTVDLERRCRRVTDSIAPFELSLDRLGAFPTVSRPRVLWVGGDAVPEFARLVASVNVELQEMGFAEDRELSGSHITLTRIKGRVDPSVEAAICAEDWPAYLLRVDRLILMESRLSPQGPTYTPLFTLPFGGHG
jgi:2'-5' RNA ligase